jgi:hypothetical protein
LKMEVIRKRWWRAKKALRIAFRRGGPSSKLRATWVEEGYTLLVGSKLGFTREKEDYGLLLNLKAVEENRALVLVSNRSERGVNI